MDNIILNDLKQRILEADDIVKLLKLRSENKKKILEIGCGIGILSKILSDYGHNVVSVDNPAYTSNDRYNDRYEKLKNTFNWPRLDFYFEIPHHQKKQLNIDAFNKLESYGKNYDFILIQAFCLWQNASVTSMCTSYFIRSLQTLLNDNGKLIIGYCGSDPNQRDIQFESSESYRWLQQYSTKKYIYHFGYYTWEMSKN